MLLAPACAPVTSLKPLPLPDDARLLAARRPAVPHFRAELTGKVRSAAGRGRFRAGLGASAAGYRLDIFHPVSGSTLLTIGVRSGTVRAVWPADGVCLEAPSSASVMETLVGMPVEPEELLPMFSGHLYRDTAVEILALQYPPMAVAAGEGPVPGGTDRVLVRAAPPSGHYVWDAELLAERDGLALRGTRSDAEGREVRLEYPRWLAAGPAGEPPFPARTEVRVPDRKLRLQLELRDLAPGGPGDGLLLPPLPAGCRLLPPGQVPQTLVFNAAPEASGEQ